MHFLETEIDSAIAQMNLVRPLAPLADRAADLMLMTLRNGGVVYTCGNGGSAADALHMSTEFVCRFRRERQGLASHCLCSSPADLTAIGNDYAFEEVFARQVRAFGAGNDCLVAISSSGNSKNISQALHAAREIGMPSIALLGRDGGFCRNLASIDLIVPGNLTARIQEAQKLIIHCLCEIIDRQMAQG